jgi:hypothetical protein
LGSGRRRAGSRSELVAADPAFPARWFDRPTSLLLYGPSEALVNLSLYALAAATSPKFQWVDLGVPGGSRSGPGPVGMGWISPERVWSVPNPADLCPDEPNSTDALFQLIRSDESPATVTRITEFLRLSETLQRILATRPLDGAPGVVAIPNVQRTRGAFPPERVRGLLHAYRTLGFSVYLGASDIIGPGPSAFDVVLRLEGSLVDWTEARVICERGIPSGPLAGSRPVPVSAIPLLATVLARVPSTP